ncbi:MAG: hypothetical protein M0002_14145 [Rhodospirillales bacterium]|nr:hypothetical protein [Rhodospirillales bacterium]
MASIRSCRLWKAVLLLAAPLLLSGCAETLQNAFGNLGMPLAANPADTCSAEQTSLEKTGNFFGEKILTGAVLGAGGGALIGLIAGGNVQSVGLGALTGAVAGGAAAYWLALQQQQRDEQALATTVGGDLARENQHLSYTEIAFQNLMQCRDGQAVAIEADYRAGRISRRSAETRMLQVKGWAEQDITLARQIDGNIESRHQQFNYALTKLGPPASAGPAAPAVTHAETLASTNAALRDSFATRVATAQNSVASGFQLSS